MSILTLFTARNFKALPAFFLMPVILLVATIALAGAPAPPKKICIDELADCGQVASGTGIKWHPGHYVQFYLGDSAQVPTYISQLKSEDEIKGVKVRVYWAQLEDRKGDYSTGIALVRSYLAAAKNAGKRLILDVSTSKFSAGTGFGVVPSYLMTDAEYEGGVAMLSDRVIARRWDADVVDRMIALSNALAKEFDEEPNFEGFTLGGETALGAVSDQPGYSNATFHAQVKRLLAAERASWTRTNLFLHANYYSAGGTNLIDLFNYAQSLDIVWAGPDLLPSTGYPGRDRGNGGTEADKVLTGAIGGVDHRGKIAVGPDSQSPVYGAKEGSYLPSEIHTYAKSMQANYIIWMRGVPSSMVKRFDRTDMSLNEYQKAVSWTEGFLPFLRTNPPIITKCPSNMMCNTN